MSIPAPIGPITYQIPTVGARGWGTQVTDLLVKLADVANQIVAANVILTSNYTFQDVSGNYGVQANFIKGVGVPASTDGFVRMASPYANPGQGLAFPVGTPIGVSNTYISWRNTLNTANLSLYPNNDNATLQFAGHTLADLDSTQTFTNKTLTSPVISGATLTILDSLFTVQDNVDPTKQLKFELSNFTTGTTKTFRFPNIVGNDDLVSLGAGQSLSNKSIDGDLNTLSNIGLTSLKTVLADANKVLVRDSSGIVVSALLANANVASAAAIALSKLAAVTASRALVSDASGFVSASSVTSTELGYVAGVTSAIQTQLNAKQATGNYITALTGDVSASGPGSATATISGLAATKIGAGTVDNTEFGYLDGVTSAIQTQINSKQATGNYLTALTGDVVAAGPGSGSATIQAGAITDAKVAAGANIDASKLGTGIVSTTEFNYLDGVTSAIQTQFSGKQPLDATLTALAAYNTNGLLVQTAADTFAGRTIAAGSAKVSVSNGDGVSGNPTIDVSEASLTLDNLGGTLSISKGGTGQVTANAAFGALSPNTTKGDITAFGTVNARLPVGADTFVLTADSTQTLGVKWAAASSGFTNPMTTLGDTIYGGSGGTATRLPAGTSGQLFISQGVAAPAWVSTSGDVTIDNAGVTSIAAGVIVNADIAGAAAIAYSKLNLSGSIVNADISASAAIAYSKLNLATSIVNADISTSAAIAFSKLATLTSGNILVGSAGGVATSVAMSSEASIVASGAVTLSNAAVIGKVLTGYTSGAGTVAATDTILQAFQKINGNTDLKAPIASPTFTGVVTIADGLVGTPSLAFGGASSNSGWYLVATDSPGLSANGVLVFSSSALGNITAGPTGGLGTTGSAYHTEHGALVNRITSASNIGSISSPVELRVGANYYLDGAGSAKAVVSSQGAAFFDMQAQTSSSSVVWTLAGNTTSQTANSAITGTTTNVLTGTAGGAWVVGNASNAETQTFRGPIMSFGNGTNSATSSVWNFQNTGGTSLMLNGNVGGGITAGESTADTIMRIRKDGTSNRSINAAGTLNASGADYAEYMVKANNSDVFARGELCGVDADGKISKSYSSAVAFLIKSTNPSYVGGDTWFTRDQQEGESDEAFEAAREAARSTVDRMAFCGQVPCTISGYAQPGDWVVPASNGDSIIATAVHPDDMNLVLMLAAVGKVIKALPNGQKLVLIGGR